MTRLATLLVLVGGWALPLHAGTAYFDPIYGVATTSNLVYGAGAINGGGGSLNLLLDLYQPTDVGQGALPAASPGIVFIHGGAWQIGSKTDSYAVDFGNFWASRGYVVASINYRLLGHDVPETHGPADLMDLSFVPTAAQGGFDLPQPQSAWTINAGIEDAAKAVGWMRDNAALYNIDPQRIGIGGASAGAINALAHAYNNPSPHEAAQVVISYVGALAGAESLIGAGEVPAFVVNGALDPLIPVAAANALVAQMNAAGVAHEFYLQPGVGHTVDYGLIFDGLPLAQHHIEFLAQHLAPEPSGFVLSCVALAGIPLVARRRRRQHSRHASLA
ncbi:MAG: alpha/beta hydrolase [Pirellulales bacterium]